MPDVKFSNQYPYTDFHELNLDWVIKEVKYWSEKVGKTIQSISLTGTVGLVDTYTITYSDGTTSTFDVTNGNGITSVAKTGTVGLIDTYTITFQDGSTSTFTVTNGAAAVDPTLTLSDYAADAKVTGDRFTYGLGDILYTGNHTYAGGPENWKTIDLTGAISLAIRLPNNSGVEYEVAAFVNSEWIVLDRIRDDDFHIVDIPANVGDKLTFTYRGVSPVTMSCIIVDAQSTGLFKDVRELQSIDNNLEKYGNYGTVATPFFTSFTDFTACPCKKVIEPGKLASIYIKSYSSGTTKIYIGEVDQLKLFVPRTSADINVAAGEQEIDVSSMNLYVNAGEQILIKFIGQTPFTTIAGTPEGDTSFYYSDTGTLQLQVYGAARAAVFGFGYVVNSSAESEQDARIAINSENIEALRNDVSVLQANVGVISDRIGNKYKMIVENGDIVLLPMNFAHVLCIGNSYTIHPTATDTEPDYANNLWWGHWAMAASTSATAWPALLQTALRQKINTASVTPVFGRRYETNPGTYDLNNANTFTYWDGSQWKSLANNLADFSDVDAIVFFLGANYSGNNWYTLYSDMVDKFLTWFPNVSLFCCSCASYSMPEKDAAIQTVASEKSATYINLIGIGGKSKMPN